MAWYGRHGWQQPRSSLEGCDKGGMEGVKEVRRAAMLCHVGWPTYERYCLRGGRHDGRDEVHKNG